MVYWLIETDTGVVGYQVMDDTLNNARLVKEDGTPLEGEFGYRTTDTNPTIPVWANA